MPDLATVFTELRSIIAPYAAKLDAKKDGPSELYVDTKYLQKNNKPLFFGAVQIKKSFVSFHLMPVYHAPASPRGHVRPRPLHDGALLHGRTGGPAAR